MVFLYDYILFLAKFGTFFILLFIAMIMSMNLRKKTVTQGDIQVTNLSTRYRKTKDRLTMAALSDTEKKLWDKEKRKNDKLDKKHSKKRNKDEKHVEAKLPLLYVLSFKGGVDAKEVSSLREEITALLSVIKQDDEVLIKLESGGGTVNGYGLAASQLHRLREKSIPFTVAVDKVAASGGYMMACVANKIISAPFAIIGSVGVVAQIPNVYRLLKKNDIDVELLTAGDYKRTLTVMGENTEKGRQKFQQELENTHVLFKEFIKVNRSHVDIDKIATGEYWYGTTAKELSLVDEIQTSDDFILDRLETHNVLAVKYKVKEAITQRVSKRLLATLEQRLLLWWQKSRNPLI